MTLRIYPILLSAALLLLLDACATAPPAPVDSTPVTREQPDEVDMGAGRDRGDVMAKAPSERDLDEIIAMTQRMSSYQPGAALAILRSLESYSSGRLTAMIDSQLYDPEFTEWLELSLQTRSLLMSRNPLPAAARYWADYHWGHAVTEARFAELVSSYSDLYPAPARVAVLLPTEGDLASAARAIRDGILSAYLDRPGNSVLRFYSSGETSQSAMAAYLQAREDGATQIVGPLRIESASALASLDDPGIPILLLNEPAEYKPLLPGQETLVNSLSLSQSEEAGAIAERALSEGQKRAIVLVQDSAWGTRIESVFTERFTQRDGRVPVSARFNPELEEYNDMLTRLLKIDESEQRKVALQVRLGIPLNFEPSRRDDFDFIFMAANPQEGRELKPLLRFHNAGDIPVYAMGRIYSGRVEQAVDQDLNGIVFPATAWQLSTTGQAAPELESIRSGTFASLYALGRDAWRVLPWLPLMHKDPDLWFRGEVGDLRLQANGHLERQPAWAQFSDGQALPYRWPGAH